MVSGISNCAELNKMLGNCLKCVSRACYWISKIYTVYVSTSKFTDRTRIGDSTYEETKGCNGPMTQIQKLEKNT